jgi:muramoyltetrapeptide carboxypeptidase LdcA involved in peptidoglycan recycling
MRGCQQEGGPTIDDVLMAVAREFDGPVLKGFPSGHTAGPTWTLPLGVRIRIRAASRPAVLVEESPVE